MLLSDETNSTKIFTNTNFPPITHYFAQITQKLTDFNWIFVPFTTLATAIKSFSLTTPQPKEQLKMTLDDDKLGMLMKHIDQYIDSAIGQKFQDNNQVVVKTVSDQLVVNFANTIKESLSAHKNAINKDDIVVMADKIKSQLKLELNVMNNEEQQSLLLNNVLLKNEKFLTEIEKVVKQNVKFNHNEFVMNNQNVDLSGILSTILASKDLHILIDDRMKIMINRLDQHDIEIAGIKGDLLMLKANVAERFISVESDVTELRGQQKSFVEDFYRFKLENDGKLEQLLLEIDGKLVQLGESKFTAVDASVRKNLLNILGFDVKTSATGEMDEKDIKSWISSMFVAKSHLEDRLKQVEMNSNVAMENEVNKNAGFFMNEINERIKNEITLAIVAKSSEMEARISTKVSVNGGLSEEDVRIIVQNVLTVYDADKTGQVDFALETAGGQVVSTRCTENYQKRNAEISIFGIPLWYPSNTPRTVISPSVHPGECWAFQGFPGFLVIQLNNMIHVTGFTLEHIPQSLAPNGIIDSAPYNFSVHGLLSEMDHEPVLFGNYHYSAQKNAPSLQYFPINNTNIDRPYQIVELRIESNHGNPQYTCLYRFRVHGNTVKTSKR